MDFPKPEAQNLKISKQPTWQKGEHTFWLIARHGVQPKTER